MSDTTTTTTSSTNRGLYNRKSPAVKRLLRELLDLTQNPSSLFQAAPLDDDLFHWHFTIRGPKDTEFQGGRYHGRLLLPTEYPFKPPNIVILTPNGRFEVNVKICLSITGYHPEYWQPAWGIRTALMALISFLPTHGQGAIGSLNWPVDERKRFAKTSAAWYCHECKVKLEEALPGEEAEEAEDGNEVDVSAFVIRYIGDSPGTANATIGATSEASISEEVASNATGTEEVASNATGMEEVASNATGMEEVASNSTGMEEVASNSTGAEEVAQVAPPAINRSTPPPTTNRVTSQRGHSTWFFDIILGALVSMLAFLLWRKWPIS